MVEKEFRDYSYRLHQIENLEQRRKSLSVVRSSSDFAERVDTGTNYSDPVSIMDIGDKACRDIARAAIKKARG